MTTAPAVVSLGSNLGERGENLAIGVDELRAAFGSVRVSAVYRTAPVGAPGSPDFWNAVCLIESDCSPLAVLRAAGRAEQRAGRRRAGRFGPRSLDVDVISVGSLVSDWSRLLLPHPRAHLRAFVLAPWLELDPDAWLVRHGPVRVLLDGLSDQQVNRLDRTLEGR